MSLTILLDADVVAYRAALAYQTLTEPKPGCFRLYCNGNRAVKHADEQIAALVEHLSADRIVMALTDKQNFRKKVLPSYKSNRAATQKPLALSFVRQHITDNYETWQLPGLEGDDVLGILSTCPDTIPGKKVIVSIDKDFHTIPGLFYNPDKDEMKEITEEEADYYHAYQTLIGDTVDGYVGILGCGPVTAKSILTDQGALWGKVYKAYETAGLTKDKFLAQARCARILRASDYCLKTKKVKLWEPPQ